MLAILVSLALLIVLTFRKINIVVVGIAAAAVMALLSGQPVVTAVTDTYMTGAAQFVRDNFLLFFFSVLFGKVMEETGAAASIAKFLAELLGEKFAILGVIFWSMAVSPLWWWCSACIPLPSPCSRRPTCPAICCPARLPAVALPLPAQTFPARPIWSM